MLQTHIYLALLGFPLALVLNRLAERELAFPYAWRESKKPAPSRRYIGMLALTLLLPLVQVVVGSGKELAVSYTLLIVLYIVTQTDLAEMIIPDRIVFAGLAVALGIRVFDHPLPLWNYIVAAFAGSGFLLIVGVIASRLLRKEAMGGGDVKLYLFIGVVLGIKLTLLSIFAASAIGLLGALLQKLFRSKEQEGDAHLPFGPSIAIGSLLCCLWGDPLFDWYIGLLQ